MTRNSPAPALSIEPPRAGEIEQFSTTLETVYDCVLEPDNWPTALREINLLTGADSAAFHWGDIRTKLALETYHVGMSPEFLEALRINSIYWVTQVDAINWKLGDVKHLDDLLPRDEFERGRFYREVIVPHRQCDYMAVNPVQDGPRLASLSVNTNIETGRFTPRAIELMRLMAPHVCRAARISAAFDLRTIRASMLEKTFDALASGVVLFNQQRQVIYTNAAAQRLIHGHRSVSLAGGKLIINRPEAEEALAMSLAALRQPATKGEAPATIAIPDADTALILTVMPIESGRRKDLLGAFEATAAIFIQSMGATPPMPGAALTQLYRFTPAENKVTIALLQGFSIADAADILGIGDATVRSHIRKIFAKTGTSRQPELIQLLMRAMSPVAGAS